VSRIRVLLADDHALVREGIRSLLDGLADVQVVAEAADGREALRLVAQHQPDVALVDISMPGLNGLEVVASARKDHPRTRIVVLSMHKDDEYVQRALRWGAAGYLLKSATCQELEMAVRAVARGEIWLSSSVSQPVVTTYLRAGESSSVEALSSRQRQVLQLIAEGHSTKEIAQRLGLSVKTVEGHRTQLTERLGIHGIPGLVRYAIRVGLVSPEN
jgi:DNA-binding NarL/FixJ family response regulator